jgi:hypothetical protein
MKTQKALKSRLFSHSTPENHRITPRNAQKITQGHAPSEGNDVPFPRRIRLQAPRTSVNSCLEKNPAAQKSDSPVGQIFNLSNYWADFQSVASPQPARPP